MKKENPANIGSVFNLDRDSIVSSICEEMPGGFMVYCDNEEENIVYFNKQLVKIYECETRQEFEEFTSLTFGKLVHPEDIDGVKKSIDDQMRDNPEKRAYAQFRIITRTGSIHWLKAWGHYVKSPKYGNVYYVFLEDATEDQIQKENDKKLQRLTKQRMKDLERLEHETTSLNLIHELMGSGMWSVDFDESGEMSKVLWSNEFRRMIGYNGVAEFPNTRQAWIDILHPVDKPRVLEDFYGTINDYSGKKIYDVEYRLRTKNRGYRWFRALGKISRRRDGTPVMFVGMFVDIHDRKLADEAASKQISMLEERTLAVDNLQNAIKETENNYRIIHKLINSGMWSMDYNEKGKRIGVNWSDEFRQMLGYKDENDFPNRLESWANLLHPDDWNIAFDNIDKAVYDYTGNTEYNVEYRLKTKDKGYRWFRVHGDVTRRPDGTPVKFFGVFFDITDKKEHDALERERQKALEELEQANSAMNTIHEVLDSGLWSIQYNSFGERDEVIWSDVALKMVGYTDKNDYENSLEWLWSIIHPDDVAKAKEEFEKAEQDYEGNTIFDTDFRMITKKNGYRWYRVAGKHIRKENGLPITFYGLFMDIDSRKEMEKQIAIQQENLKEALAAAQHSNRAKTVFLNNMSHDIRTPMNAIIGLTAIASRHIDNTELVKQYLAKIMTSSNHLLSLINDVLDMSRIESGKMKLEEKEANLPEIMHDLKTIVLADINSKQLDFYIDTVDILDENIICDKLRLNQILLNILSNAMKFTPPGGLVSVRITQKPCNLKGCASFEFKVRDTGIGMSEKFMEHLFEPFERERNTTVSGIQGTGLGMAITKNIVDMMNGTISVTSEEGKGTEITILLPFRLSGKTTKIEPIPQLKGLRALVADDDYNTCASVTKMLCSMGLHSDWTTSGKEAVLRAKLAMEQGEEFGVYIIDWMMPDLNGVETVRRIRQIIGDDKPIIIMTAYDWADIEEEAKQAGVTAFCSKPLFMSELREVLAKPFEKQEVPTAKPIEEKYKGKKILLVEDNELNREIAQTVLEEAGFTVFTANDGDVAIQMVKDSTPGDFDVILMDIQMPTLDGYEATRGIRALENKALANIPIIAMTANAFEEDKQKAFEAEMNDHVTKPIVIKKLFGALDKVFEKSL